MIALRLIEQLTPAERAEACAHLEHSEAGLRDVFLYQERGAWRELEAIYPRHVRGRSVKFQDYRKPSGEAKADVVRAADEPREGEATATPADLPGQNGPAHGVGEAKAGAGESAGLNPGGVGLQRESGMTGKEGA